MKAEERHEARDNDLASGLQFGLMHFVREYGSYVLLLGALGFLGYQLWNMQQQKKLVEHRNAFEELRQASRKNENKGYGRINPADPESLKKLMANTPYNEVKARAALALASYYQEMVPFPEAIEEEFKTRREDVLNNAMENFRIALEAMPDDLLIAGRAHLGMAAVYEDQGLWDKAKAEYQVVADPKGKYAGTPTAELADARLKSLSDRQFSPRLVAMIPKAAKPQPAAPPIIPGLPGSSGLFDLNTPLPSIVPGTPMPASRPSSPSLPPTPIGPFLGPAIPGITPEAPASAPAETAPAK